MYNYVSLINYKYSTPVVLNLFGDTSPYCLESIKVDPFPVNIQSMNLKNRSIYLNSSIGTRKIYITGHVINRGDAGAYSRAKAQLDLTVSPHTLIGIMINGDIDSEGVQHIPGATCAIVIATSNVTWGDQYYLNSEVITRFTAEFVMLEPYFTQCSTQTGIPDNQDDYKLLTTGRVNNIGFEVATVKSAWGFEHDTVTNWLSPGDTEEDHMWVRFKCIFTEYGPDYITVSNDGTNVKQLTAYTIPQATLTKNKNYNVDLTTGELFKSNGSKIMDMESTDLTVLSNSRKELRLSPFTPKRVEFRDLKDGTPTEGTRTIRITGLGVVPGSKFPPRRSDNIISGYKVKSIGH